MSKYSTEELVDMLASFLGASTAPSSVQFFEGDAMREAMRRLRAADNLCEAANPIVGEISNFADNDLTEYQVIRFKDLVRLRKRIADYEGAGGKP